MTRHHYLRLRVRRARQGFALMELVITLAIVGIMAAVAYPSYTESVLDGRRAHARAALQELMRQQTRYRAERNTYLAFSNTAGTTVPADASVALKVFARSGDAGTTHWLHAAACAKPRDNLRECVRLEAVPVQADASAGTLHLDSTGNKGCSGDRPALCWP